MFILTFAYCLPGEVACFLFCRSPPHPMRSACGQIAGAGATFLKVLPGLVFGDAPRQEETGTTEDEMVRWHHRLDGHEFG